MHFAKFFSSLWFIIQYLSANWGVRTDYGVILCQRTKALESLKSASSKSHFVFYHLTCTATLMQSKRKPC